MSLRHYVTLGVPQDGAPSKQHSHDTSERWQIHYREQGEGLPVVLLHPSPMHSGFMQPIINVLSKDCKVYAWDTPGYGYSDPLPEPLNKRSDLLPYVSALHAFLQALDIKQAVLYGSATGAQVAIEYAKAHPNNIKGIVLENAAWFTEDERSTFLSQYFPSISARDDGSHLTLTWQMVSQLYQYFPWYDVQQSSKISEHGVPTELKHNTLLAYLLAGDNYAQAYRAAFMNERPEQLRKVSIPAHIINWDSGMLKKYVDRLNDANLPSNIHIKPVKAGMENRFAAIRQSVAQLLADAR